MFFNFSNGVSFPIGTLENHDIVGFVGVLLGQLEKQGAGNGTGTGTGTGAGAGPERY